MHLLVCNQYYVTADSGRLQVKSCHRLPDEAPEMLQMFTLLGPTIKGRVAHNKCA